MFILLLYYLYFVGEKYWLKIGCRMKLLVSIVLYWIPSKLSSCYIYIHLTSYLYIYIYIFFLCVFLYMWTQIYIILWMLFGLHSRQNVYPAQNSQKFIWYSKMPCNIQLQDTYRKSVTIFRLPSSVCYERGYIWCEWLPRFFGKT